MLIFYSGVNVVSYIYVRRTSTLLIYEVSTLEG